MTRQEFDIAFSDYYKKYVDANKENPNATEWIDAMLQWYEFIVIKNKYQNIDKDRALGLFITSTKRRWINERVSQDTKTKKMRTYKASFVNDNNNPQYNSVYAIITNRLKSALTELEYEIFVLHFEHKLRFTHIHRLTFIGRKKLLEIVNDINTKLLKIICKWD